MGQRPAFLLSNRDTLRAPPEGHANAVGAFLIFRGGEKFILNNEVHPQ